MDEVFSLMSNLKFQILILKALRFLIINRSARITHPRLVEELEEGIHLLEQEEENEKWKID